MGAVPSFTHMLRHHSWRALFTWAMGPNFNTKLRLVGPWARPEAAAEVMANELYHVVKRPGGFVCECSSSLGFGALTNTDRVGVSSLVDVYFAATGLVWLDESGSLGVRASHWRI